MKTHLYISSTFAVFPNALSQAKNIKRATKPSHQVRKKNRKLMTKIKHEPVTRYIKHLAESANFKGSTFNKHRNGLIGNHFEMPNVSYTLPL